MASFTLQVLIVDKNPRRPVLIPTIGMPKSFTPVIALKIVPSPPMLMSKSKEESNVLKDTKFSKFTLGDKFF